MADMKQIRRHAKRQVDRLSASRLQAAADFLDYLANREDDAATAELLEIAGLPERISRAQADRDAGRAKPWRQVRDDV